MKSFKLKNLKIFWKFFLSQIATIIFLGVILGITVTYLVEANLRDDHFLYADTAINAISTEINYVTNEYDDFFSLSTLNSEIFSRSLNNPDEFQSVKNRKFLLQFYQMQIHKEAVTSLYAYTAKDSLYYARAAKCTMIDDDNHFIKRYISENAESLINNVNSGKFIVFDDQPESIFYMRAIYSEFLFEYEGIFVVELNATDFFKSFVYNLKPEKGDILISYRDGTLIYQSANTLGISDIDFSPSTFSFSSGTANGVDYLGLSTAANDNPFTVTYYVSKDDLYYKVDHLIVIISLLILIYVLLALIATFFVSSSLTAGIRRLAKQIKNMQKGKLHLSQKEYGTDEIGRLEQTFNDMSSQMNDVMLKLVAEQAKKEQLEHTLLIAEYNKLLSQLNPHFLYNVLESINGFAKNKGQPEIALMIQELGIMMRSNLEAQDDVISLQREIDYIENYFSLYSTMLTDKIEAIYTIDDAVATAKIPRLILQPIAENAIKHSAEHMHDLCVIAITAYPENNNLVISISDNGLGIDPETLSHLQDVSYRNNEQNDRAHIGLPSIHDRIRTIYGEPYGIAISSELGVGTVVTITLPLNL